jgi:hypothetical protein
MAGLGEHSLRILEGTGSSFLVGALTAMVGSVARNKRVSRYFAVEQPIRSAGDSAAYAFLHSLLYYGLDRLGLASGVRMVGSSFLASFAIGYRNGLLYGVKNGLSGVVTMLVSMLARWK